MGFPIRFPIFGAVGFLFCVLSSSVSWAQKTLCSMTLNSDDELKAFQRHLAPQGFKFVELVPNNKDPDWFEKACRSQVRCDVLVISGHFGGLYFGEKRTPILKLIDMERASCERSCAGILEAPQEVFLLGCNTLAGKSPDHRTPMEYLRVLVSDGFPRDEAERIVTSRYSQEGFSMAQRSALSFAGAKKVYGFDGTGPLGKQAAPRIERYLKSVGNYSAYLDRLTDAPNSRLGQAFSGFSIRSVTPAKLLDSKTRQLSCDLKFSDGDRYGRALREVMVSDRSKEFLDHLRDRVPPAQVHSMLAEAQRVNPNIDSELRALIAQSSRQHADLLSVRSGLLRLSLALGHLSLSQWRQELNSILESSFKKEMNLVRADQVCDLARSHPDLIFSTRWLQESKFRNSEYLPYVLGCFAKWEAPVLDWFKKIDLAKMPKSYRQEMLRTLKDRWSPEDIPVLMAHARSLKNVDDLYELYRSAADLWLQAYANLMWNIDQKNEIFEVFPIVDATRGEGAACLSVASQASDADSRNGLRWQCLERENLSRDLWSCLKVSSQMEGTAQQGIDWQCLLKPSARPTLGLCLDLAGRNPYPESADDMRWTCWDKHKVGGHFTRSECVRLAASMSIEGNRIKANWNCMNLKETTSAPEQYTFLKEIFDSQVPEAKWQRLPARSNNNP